MSFSREADDFLKGSALAHLGDDANVGGGQLLHGAIQRRPRRRDKLLDRGHHRRRQHNGFRDEQGQILNDVQQMQLRAEPGGERRSVGQRVPRRLAEIGRDQNAM